MLKQLLAVGIVAIGSLSVADEPTIKESLKANIQLTISYNGQPFESNADLLIETGKEAVLTVGKNLNHSYKIVCLFTHEDAEQYRGEFEIYDSVGLVSKPTLLIEKSNKATLLVKASQVEGIEKELKFSVLIE